jgi:hypothetical protein
MGKMYFSVFKGSSKYVALAKKEPFTCDNPDPIYEPGELWFEIGDTSDQALERLKESLKKDGNNIKDFVSRIMLLVGAMLIATSLYFAIRGVEDYRFPFWGLALGLGFCVMSSLLVQPK